MIAILITSTVCLSKIWCNQFLLITDLLQDGSKCVYIICIYFYIISLNSRPLIRGLKTGGPLVGFGNYNWGRKRYLHLELGAKSLRQQANLLNVNCYWYKGFNCLGFSLSSSWEIFKTLCFPSFPLESFSIHLRWIMEEAHAVWDFITVMNSIVIDTIKRKKESN